MTKEKIIWEGLGFPVELVGFTMKKINGEFVPALSLKRIQDTVFHALTYKEGPLTGNEIKFARTYLQLSKEKFAKYINVSDHIISQWESKLDNSPEININTEIMIRLFMAKQCEELNIDLVWENMKDIIFDFANTIKTEKYVSIYSSPTLERFDDYLKTRLDNKEIDEINEDSEIQLDVMKHQYIDLKLPDELKKKLIKLANEKKISINQYITEVLEDHLRQQSDKEEEILTKNT